MANQVSNVGFGSPYSAQQAEIQRKQKLAHLLQQQSMEPIQQQQGGMFTPRTGWAQMLAKGVQAYAGKKGMADTTAEQTALSQKMQQERQQALAQALAQGQGSPQPAPEQGGGPAMPPDPMGASQTLAGANDPALQQAGLQMIGKQFEAQMPKRPEPFTMAPGATRYGPDGKPIATAPMAPEKPQAYTLPPGGVRFDPQGNEVARVPPTPPQPPAPAPFTLPPGSTRFDAKGNPIANVPKPPPGANRPMSATVQKELIQTEEEIEGARAAIGIIKQAEGVNEKAMGFTGAGAVASAGTLLPNALKPKTVDATIELDNLIQGSALPQLKAIFGGLPTEGERAILLELQGSSSKPASVRKGIFKRAIQAAERRVKFGSDKAKQLRAGTYFQEQSAPETPGGNVDDLLEKYK